MKPQQQRIAIAKACGFKCSEYSDELGQLIAEFTPDYLNDLNAIHEAEKVLNNVQRERYRTELVYSHAGRDVFATAAQRAEAFLRTIGKWEEDK
jgi:transposase